MFLNNKIVILPSFCIGICVTLLVLPLQWVLAWFAGVLIHELGHYIALKTQHISTDRITLSFRGAYMEIGCMESRSEFITALAGPLAGLFCLLASSYCPMLAVCGFVQSIYNLLPFPDFDGGRALKVVLAYFLSAEQVDTVFRCTVIVLSAVLVILGIYLWLVVKLGPFILLIFMIPILKSGFIKIPCKGGKEIVQ